MNWKRKLLNKCTLQNTINIYQKTKVKTEGPKNLIRQPPPPPPPHPISGSGWPPQDYREDRKSPKISSEAYTLQRPLLRGLFFGGAYVRRKICVSKSIGLACGGKEIYHFCFVLLCIPGQIPSTSLRGGGAYIRRGDLTEGFLRYDFEGLIRRGLVSEFYGSFNKQSTRQWQLNIEIKT